MKMLTVWISILFLLPSEVHDLILSHNTQTPTAFTKGQTTHLHLTKGEKIPFNKRITEIGAHFDSEGSFICQTPGLYAFTFHGLTANNWGLWVEMMKNDELIASIYAYTHNGYADAGNTAILHLNVGDKVYLKGHQGSNQTMYGSADQIYTTFTGELLHPDNVEFKHRKMDHYVVSQQKYIQLVYHY
ncbi:complement C1q-like protein 2, partial [Saccostrea cucullata]|uniref:complement C1q-like protein 2 n=1 Tax=Saccostrea cuccullata TaxID=36930 RepID=UPI002ED41C1C